MKQHSKDILFYIETDTQFESLKPLLEYLKNNTTILFDIVVPGVISKETKTNKEIYTAAAKLLAKNGFDVIRGIDNTVLPKEVINTRYKVLLSGYMYDWHYRNLSVKYRIMFPYASYYFNKPNWTISRFIGLDYMTDALLSHAVGTKPITDIFTRTYVVPSLKLMEFSKDTTPRKKPVLLFAPTYNEIDFAANLLKNIDDIKKEYFVIMRGHHRSTRVKDNKSVPDRLYEAADKIYDSEKHSVVEALGVADIVISDNSALIFDAIYCGIPVALFSQDPDSFKYRDISTIQAELVEKGEVLWTNSPEAIPNIAKETLSERMISKQKKMQQRLFPKKDTTDPVAQWMEVLAVYLEEKLPYEYTFVKQYWVEYIQKNADENQKLRAELEESRHSILEQRAKIHTEQNPSIKTAIKRLIKACLYKLGLMERSA